MAVNKVIYYGEVLVDMSQVSVNPENLVEGETALDASGELITGQNPYEKTATDTEVGDQSDLLDQAIAALNGKAAGGSGGIVPSGAIEITENGTYDVTNYAQAVVNVASGGGGATDNRELYQRVESITSDGESYAITDFIGDNSSGLELVASFPTLVDRPPMGSRTDTGATRFYCVYPLSANSCYFGFNTGSTISCPLVANTVYRLQTNFMNSRLVNIIDANGVRKGGTSISATLAQQNVPVAIFGYHHGGTNTINSLREFTLYSARVSKGNDIVREYIPCYRKADGVIGLYEKYTGTFLENAGSGAFTAGADVDWEV